jgi:hypothetical protein
MTTNVCVGGGSNSSFSSNPQDYVTQFGYVWSSTDPYAVVYPLILAQLRPKSQKAGGPWDALCEACMRTRAILFCNTKPGDCQTSVLGTSSLSLVSSTSKLALSGAQLGESIAGVASSALGVATLGIGIILSGVLQIFQAHAAAEARQSSALCGIAGPATNAIQATDAAVASGQASPAQGYATMQQIYTAMVGSLASIYKSGNAADGYDEIMECQVALAGYRYGIVAFPVSVSSPITSVSVSPNATIAASAGTSSLEVSNPVAASLAPVAVAPMPVSEISTSTILIVIVIALAVFWLSTRGAR